MDIQTIKSTNFSSLTRKVLDDNPILVSKIVVGAEVTEEEVPLLLEEVLRFLFLIRMGNQILTPSHIVDMAWHEFILCTRYYAQFCEEHFEKFIHHHPGGLEEDNHRQFHQTLKLYALAFGEISSKYWGPAATFTEISEESACGSCSN